MTGLVAAAAVYIIDVAIVSLSRLSSLLERASYLVHKHTDSATFSPEAAFATNNQLPPTSVDFRRPKR